MRYLMQFIVMRTDLMLICASAIAICLFWDIFPANLLAIFFVWKIFQGWQKTGGFEAWNPVHIKRFMANAKKAGL